MTKACRQTYITESFIRSQRSYCTKKQVKKGIVMEIIQQLEKTIDKNRILINESMKKHTSYNVGGQADIMIKPANVTELIEVIKTFRTNNFPYIVLGRGSNILINDEGIRGAVIKLGSDFANIKVDKNFVRAESGISLRHLADFCANKGLGGLEFAHGIPGTLGGAVCMNAGAYGGEMKQVITKVKLLDNDLNIIELSSKEMDFGYRTSIVQKNNYIVLEAEFELENKPTQEILDTMKELMARRKAKQPLNYPSCGSVFKRPEGYYAGGLIEESGLKGMAYGGAMVSDKHAGFIVNTGTATAKDIITLIQIVQKCVFDLKGVRLEREVKLL